MADGNDRIGVLSLSLAVAGVLLPIVLVILFVALADGRVIKSAEPYVGLCALLFLAFQVLAFATGRPSRDTPSGRAGFRIAMYALILAGVLFILSAASLLLYAPQVQSPPSPAQGTTAGSQVLLEASGSVTERPAPSPRE